MVVAVWFPVVEIHWLADPGNFRSVEFHAAVVYCDYSEGLFVLVAMQRKYASLWIGTSILGLDFFK